MAPFRKKKARGRGPACSAHARGPKAHKARAKQASTSSLSALRRARITEEIMECVSTHPSWNRDKVTIIPRGSILIPGPGGVKERVASDEVESVLRELVRHGKLASAIQFPGGFRITVGRMPTTAARHRKGPSISDFKATSPSSVEKILKAIPRMDPSKLVNLWQNACRTLSNEKRQDEHAAARRIAEAVEAAWSTLELKEGELFPWPTTEVGPRSGATSVPGFRSEGMLSYLEYRVGKTAGLSSRERQVILSRVFEGKLPRVFEPAYMEEWGDPKSARRLKKMAESLAAFARNFKRLDEDKYDEAIRQWEQDLDFLYHAYYLGRFGFGWPTTDVGTPSLCARR